VDEFRRFVAATHYQTEVEENTTACDALNEAGDNDERRQDRNWREPGFGQSGKHPVVCVSFQDAQAYVVWLRQVTGQSYRLPTEAEWEYAARGRTATRFSFGNDLNATEQCSYANGRDQTLKSQKLLDKYDAPDCVDGFAYTSPVGHFKPNAFGLYDMHGNVSEWTQDCWHENYEKAPVDGLSWLEAAKGNCSLRVLRGGSWVNYPGNLRSAYRGGINDYGAFLNVGFRLARTLRESISSSQSTLVREHACALFFVSLILCSICVAACAIP
jgi:formylglycine-generating enzyme required for sulfatase activity